MDDDLYFAWVLRDTYKNNELAFMPVIYREGVAPSGLKYVYAKWKLPPGEHWLGLDELRERYPLKGR